MKFFLAASILALQASAFAPLAPGRPVTVLEAKKVSFKEESRQALVKGINQVANAVRVTLGPRGMLPFNLDLLMRYPCRCDGVRSC